MLNKVVKERRVLMMRKLLITFLIFLYIGSFDCLYARRVRDSGSNLYSWSAEELSLVKEGYVLIYDKQTGRRIRIFNKYVPSEFLQGHRGIVVKKRLDSGGFLSLGRPKMHYFRNFPYAFAIFEIPINLSVSRVCLYDDRGVLQKEYDLWRIKIFDNEGELIDCYFNLSPEKFTLLDDVILETRLDKNGYLQIGGRIRGHFYNNPHSKVRVKVNQGVITSVTFLDEAGNVIQKREYNLIYDRHFKLIDSFMYRFPGSFLRGFFYVQRRISEDGRLKFRGESLVKLPSYRNCIGFIKIINGEAKSYWIVDGDEILVGETPGNFTPESWVRDL